MAKYRISGVPICDNGKLIGIITSLIVIIRIAEIFVDPLLGNLVDNTTTKWGRFRPWQFIGGLVSSVLIVLIFSGMFGLVNVNTTLFPSCGRHRPRHFRCSLIFSLRTQSMESLIDFVKYSIQVLSP